MQTSPAGRAAIARREGNILKAYTDSVGVLTIGVGHTSTAGEPKVTKGLTITAAQSDEILARDLASVEASISSLVKVPLNQNEFDALVSLVFNIGAGAFRKSSVLKSLNAGNRAGAADAMLAWNKGTVKGKKVALPGLTTRRKDERAQFLTAAPEAASPAADPATPAPQTQAEPPAAPDAPVTAPTFDKETIARVQQQLKDLGYTEVGGVDGKAGDFTASAIRAFRTDNGLPAGDGIDDDLLLALQKAKPRVIPAARADAPAEVVRDKVPEVKANWLSKVGGYIVGIPAAIGAVFKPALDNIPVAKTYVDPLTSMASDVPGWVWLAGVAGIAGTLVLVARHGEKKGVEAFQTGARR